MSITEQIALEYATAHFLRGMPPMSGLCRYIMSRLPKDYIVSHDDIVWLNKVAEYWIADKSNDQVLHAFKLAVEAHPNMHHDPYEFLVDANICDSDLNPIAM